MIFRYLRFFMLSAHYRSPLNFSAELMEAAKKRSGAYRDSSRTFEIPARRRNTTENMTETEKAKITQKRQEFVPGNSKKPWMMISIQQMQSRQCLNLVKFINTNTDGESSKEYLAKPA